eukprot:gene44916-54937_t
MVKAGDLLAEIDPRSYQNALLQAQGTLMQNQAQLKNAQVDVERYRGLYAQNNITKQTLDTAKTQVSETVWTKKLKTFGILYISLELSSSHIYKDSFAIEHRVQEKKSKYTPFLGEDGVSDPHRFVPFVLEASGRLGPEAKAFLEHLKTLYPFPIMRFCALVSVLSVKHNAKMAPDL